MSSMVDPMDALRTHNATRVTFVGTLTLPSPLMATITRPADTVPGVATPLKRAMRTHDPRLLPSRPSGRSAESLGGHKPREAARTTLHLLNLRLRALGIAAALSLRAIAPVGGQTNSSSTRGAAWLDPTSTRPEAQVYRAWRDYFDAKGRDLRKGAGTPSSLWVADEQAKWPMYDLAGFYVPEGAVPEVASIRPLPGSEASDYEIAVNFFSAPSGGSRAKRAIALTATWRVKRQAGRWLVANVLPERTRLWHTETVGQITYYVEPGLAFDRTRALQAVGFVDSLADAFGVPHLGRLDYYVTATVDAALKAIGVEYPSHFGPGGGFAKPVNQQLFAAVPAWGENYRHELTHLVLRPLLKGPTMTVLASEGIATWYGGSSGAGLPATIGHLRDYLAKHPGITLDSVMASRGIPQLEIYASGAVLCDMLFRRGGVTDLKAFLAAGPGTEQLRAALIQMLGQPWEGIVADWRKAIDRMARPPS